MITRLSALCATCVLCCGVYVTGDFNDGLFAFDADEVIITDNRRKERRDDRGDDRDAFLCSFFFASLSFGKYGRYSCLVPFLTWPTFQTFA